MKFHIPKTALFDGLISRNVSKHVRYRAFTHPVPGRFHGKCGGDKQAVICTETGQQIESYNASRVNGPFGVGGVRLPLSRGVGKKKKISAK